MPYVSVRGTRLYYAEKGPSTGRPLLLLHAALQTGESMEPVRAAVEPLGLRVVAPDQRGHGRSGNPGGGLSIAGLADDMVALMSEVGLERPVVVGYSLGGIVGVELARRGLVSGLVVMASRIHPVDVESRSFEPEDIRRRSPVWAGQLSEKHAESWEALAVEIGTLLKQWAGFSVADLAAIDSPVLVVQGDKDQMVPVEQGRELAAGVAGARLKVVPGAGHPDLLYRPDAVDAVREFVAPLSGGSPTSRSLR